VLRGLALKSDTMSEDDGDFTEEISRGLKLKRKAREVLAVRRDGGPTQTRRAFRKIARGYLLEYLSEEGRLRWWVAQSRDLF